MAKKTESIVARSKRFVSSAKNQGALGLQVTRDGIEHMFEHKDWTPLAWMVGKLESRDAAVIRKIINTCVENLKMVKDAKQPSGVRFIVTADTRKSNKFAMLDQLVENAASFRGKDVAEALFDKKESEGFDMNKAIENLAKRLIREDVDSTKFVNLLEIKIKEINAAKASA